MELHSLWKSTFYENILEALSLPHTAGPEKTKLKLLSICKILGGLQLSAHLFLAKNPCEILLHQTHEA